MAFRPPFISGVKSMDLTSIIDMAKLGTAGIAVILAGLIKIPKLELNFWSFLARSIGRALNRELIDRVDKLTKDLEHHITMEEEENARTARRRFLRFNDELIEGKKHTKEHFDEILDDIDIYVDYCLEHPKYENSKAEAAIKYIKKTYQECLEEHKFLQAP